MKTRRVVTAARLGMTWVVCVGLLLTGWVDGLVQAGRCDVARGSSAVVRVATIGGVPVVVDGRGRVRVLATVAVPVAYPLGGYSSVLSGYAPAAGNADVAATASARSAEEAPRWEVILRQRCGKCHTGENEAGVTLLEGDGATVAKGFADEAVLYEIVTEGMPKGGSLSVEEKATLVAWLRTRAKERK